METQLQIQDFDAALQMSELHEQLVKFGFLGHDLGVFLIRLLFCFFSEHNGIFQKGMLLGYLKSSKRDGSDLSSKLESLFKSLNMSGIERKNNTKVPEKFKNIPNFTIGIFDEPLPKADFDAHFRKLLLDCVIFDWNKISPLLFGAIFQGAMDKTKRREIGVHYTSEENILKLIRPLFLDDLKNEYESVKEYPKKLQAFLQKISQLKFLDPACGSGDFLIITYRELLQLEQDAIKHLKSHNKSTDRIRILTKVGLHQFYGIENDYFACQIAKLGLFLMSHQNITATSNVFNNTFPQSPVPNSPTIVHSNALNINWENVVAKQELSFIFGNPPFVGYSNQSLEQKQDILRVSGLAKIDYVAAWFFKAANYIMGTNIRCAFVSTNSINQGEQATAVWKPLISDGLYINFKVPAFKWNNLAKSNAQVYCVIIGFSRIKTTPNINQYLIDAPTVFIESRNNPICDVPKMVWGNKSVDGGFLMLTPAERQKLLSRHPQALKYIKRICGAHDFINNYEQYCLWLVDANPDEVRSILWIRKRLDKVREFRLESKKQSTRKLAKSPMLFMENRQPDSEYILIPRVSSKNRHYIPIGFVPPEIIANSSVHMIPGTKETLLYHFGILTSNVHMAWVRIVCGRLKADYRYSKDIVYNNFPWPQANKNEKEAIRKAAQGVLSSRIHFPNKSLAELYTPSKMPEPLLKAHQNLDCAVMEAYKLTRNTITEISIFAKLMAMYQDITKAT
ncbi:MAG: N-6 DNA methylase [Deltaproteobacteria bacterium]|nr:N-6 DNA methylase [Deltaproteobacteria bacterium]